MLSTYQMMTNIIHVRPREAKAPISRSHFVVHGDMHVLRLGSPVLIIAQFSFFDAQLDLVTSC